MSGSILQLVQFEPTLIGHACMHIQSSLVSTKKSGANAQLRWRASALLRVNTTSRRLSALFKPERVAPGQNGPSARCLRSLGTRRQRAKRQSSYLIVRIDDVGVQLGICQAQTQNLSRSSPELVKFRSRTCQVRAQNLSRSSLELAKSYHGTCPVRSCNLSSSSPP